MLRPAKPTPFPREYPTAPGRTRPRPPTSHYTGSVPPGTILKVIAEKCTEINSGGKLGRPGAAINLSGMDQNIIVGIGTCYTGTGYNDGHQLTYTWIPTSVGADYDLIKSTSSTVNIMVAYTLSEDK